MVKGNSFDSLRLFGSIIVLVGHSFLITGAPVPVVGTIEIHTFGVCIFFAISGFLITQSYLSDSHFGRYLLRRLLRIIPALAVVAVATALLIGAWVTTEPLTEYYTRGWTWRYIVSNTALMTVWSLPGVFNDLPVSGQANGSLWTLPIEFSLYLLVPVLLWTVRIRHSAIAGTLLALALMVTAAKDSFPAIFSYSFYGIDFGNGLALAPWFWVGCALRLLNMGAWVALPMRVTLILCSIVVTIWLVLAEPVLLPVAVIPLSILLISVGQGSALHSPMIGKLGDISYGTYLWAFPIQQLVLLKIGGDWKINLAIAGPVTFLLAFLSWQFIERPALRLKPHSRQRDSRNI